MVCLIGYSICVFNVLNILVGLIDVCFIDLLILLLDMIENNCKEMVRYVWFY